MTIVVENKTFNGTVINGTAIINLTNITTGVHNITVIYSGDANYTNATVNATVTISKLITPIKVNVNDIYVGDVARINVTVPDGATGKVRIEINGKEYFEPIENGVARFKVENLTAGIKTVYASYVGDNNYTGNHTSANFTVKKINVTAPVDVTRPVIVNVGGVDYAVNITNGIGQLPVSGLDSGKYGVTIKYLGDDKYLTAHNTTGFKVSKVPSNITVVVNNITVGDVAIINMTVPKDATGNITVRVNNHTLKLETILFM